MERRRRAFLVGCGAAITGGATLNRRTRWGFATNATSPTEAGPTIGLRLIADGFDQPLAFETGPDDRTRYVADKTGRILVHEEGGVRSEPLLDVTDRLTERTSWEQGLLGFALHPDFEENRKYYVRYSGKRREGTPDSFAHTFVLAEFEATDDYRRTVPGSERAILELPEADGEHNGGGIAFGPNGYLHVGVGTGSTNGGDRTGKGKARDWYLLNSGGNGQNRTANLKGAVLRIDVDDRGGDRPYAIPPDNPLLGKKGRDELYAWGLRNPYRLSFDGDDLYVGDVGQNKYEEINRVRRGGNYGWNVREGYRCFSNRLPIAALAKLPGINRAYPACPTTTPDGEPLVDPVVCYPHHEDGEQFGMATVGGYVYRSETIPSLTDRFVFGDLFGGLFVSTPRDDGEGVWPMAKLNVAADGESRPAAGGMILSLGRDRDGELYALTSQLSEGTGKVFKLVPEEG